MELTLTKLLLRRFDIIKDMSSLISWAQGHEVLYNQVANKLYSEFGIKGCAEITLIITYMITIFGGETDD